MKKRLFFLPMVAIMMAACSSNETIEVNENKGDLISFRPIVKGVTRTADADLSSDGTSFNVEAFYTGETTSLYFSNVTFTNSGGTFTSATKYYWPASGSLDFYAYSPITEDISGAQKGALSNDNYQIVKTDYKTFTITPSTTVSEQVDFIYANTNKSKGASTNGATTLNFRHAGAKIAVKVKNSAPNLKFEISGWKLGYLDNTATFTYGDATTDTQGSAQLAFTDWSENTTQSAANTYSTTFTANAIAAESTAYFLGNAGTPSTSATDESINMILIPQTLTAATAYASTTAGAKPNGSYIALKMVIKNNTTAGETVADATANDKWAIWPIGGYNWEPGKKYTYTIDLAGGGYYETNQDTDADLDPILEGAEIKFATVTVDGWTQEAKGQAPINLADLGSIVDMGADCSSYIGWIVTSDGYIYKDNASVDAVSKTGVAMIAYLGSETGESAPYNHGLAISLVNANGGTVSAEGEECQWKNVPLDNLTAFENLVQWNYDFTKLSQFTVSESGLQYISRSADATTYPAFAAAASNNGALPPYGSSGWFLPSIWQWEKMYYSFGNGKSYLRDAFASRGGRNLYANRYQSGYWSCSETDWDPRKAWLINFFSGLSECGKEYKSGAHGYVRSIVAF